MIVPKKERELLPPERKRDKQLKIWVSQEELDMIHQKMAEFGTPNMGAFVRKMVIDGYIVKLDIPELKEIIRKLLVERRDNALLHTGFLSVETPDEDTIRIIRSFENGQDAFGDAAEDQRIVIDIKR